LDPDHREIPRFDNYAPLFFFFFRLPFIFDSLFLIVETPLLGSTAPVFGRRPPFFWFFYLFSTTLGPNGGVSLRNLYLSAALHQCFFLSASPPGRSYQFPRLMALFTSGPSVSRSFFSMHTSFLLRLAVFSDQRRFYCLS